MSYLMLLTTSGFSYKSLTLSFVYNELAFDSPVAAREFLVTHSAGFFLNTNAPDAEKILDCKAAGPNLSQVFDEKYRKIIIKGAI